MAEEEVVSQGEIDIDTETDEKLIASKISEEIAQSRSYWQEFKSLCTELYFDFLAYKESIQDSTKSNTFIPLPYVDVRVSKARIKQIITGTKPYARVKPKPYDPELSFKASRFAYDLLNEAEFESFLDLLIQDALIYTGAPFQVTWSTEHKEMPAFWDAESLSEKFGVDLTGADIRIPKFDDDGKRVFELQEVRDGIFLEVISIQDFYLPKNSKNVETDPWAAKHYPATIPDLKDAVDSDGNPYYHNLDRLKALGTTRRADTAEPTRQGQPLKRDYPSRSTFVETFPIIEFCTDKKIFHWPEGTDFLIKGPEPNPYRKKPFHIARVEKLTGEPYGFSPNRANHLLTRTMNEVVDIIMDGLFLEDNKAWILNENLVDDFEVGAIQGNLIHVHGLDSGMDVSTAIRPIETRAIASEIMPLWEKFDSTHQIVAGRPNMSIGMPSLGAETAYENAQLVAGANTPVIDMASNLVDTALRPIHEDLFYLAKIYFTKEKSMEILDDEGNPIREEPLVMTPREVYADYDFEFEFLGKERNKIEERAALTNMLMVWGNVKNVDEVTALIMKNLLLQSGISDTAAISKALDAAIQQRRQMEMMAMQAKTGGQEQGGPMSGSPEMGPGAVGAPMRQAGNFANTFKPTGA